MDAPRTPAAGTLPPCADSAMQYASTAMRSAASARNPRSRGPRLALRPRDVPQRGFHRREDHVQPNIDQINSRQRNHQVPADDHALVQHVIEHIQQADVLLRPAARDHHIRNRFRHLARPPFTICCCAIQTSRAATGPYTRSAAPPPIASRSASEWTRTFSASAARSTAKPDRASRSAPRIFCRPPHPPWKFVPARPRTARFPNQAFSPRAAATAPTWPGDNPSRLASLWIYAPQRGPGEGPQIPSRPTPRNSRRAENRRREWRRAPVYRRAAIPRSKRPPRTAPAARRDPAPPRPPHADAARSPPPANPGFPCLPKGVR